MEINKGTSAALLGIFSSDRKAAKARELQIAQTQYAMAQKKQEQQYKLSSTMAANKQAIAKQASAIGIRKADAQDLVTNMNAVIDEMKAGVNKYGGNVMKYMIAEGNEKWSTAVGDYEMKIGNLKQNEEQVAKYLELAHSDKAGLAMKKDEIALQDYIDGKTNVFRFSGQLEEINQDYSSVSSSLQVTAKDILSLEGNATKIAKNYVREYGGDINDLTQQQLEEYVNEMYLSTGTQMGTKKDDVTVGGSIYDVSTTVQQLNVSDVNIFDINSSDATFANITSEIGTLGINTNKKPRKKRGRQLVGSDEVFTSNKQDITKQVFGSDNNQVQNVSSVGLFRQSDGAKIKSSTWGGELLGGEDETYDLTLEGYHYAYKYNIDGEDQLAVMTDDPKKNEELLNSFKASGAKASLVLVAELREEDSFRDDFYYKEINMTRNLASAISDKTGYKIQNEELDDINKRQTQQKNKRTQKAQAITNLSNNFFDSNDVLVEQTQSEALTTLLPVFKKHGVNQRLFTPLLASLMTQSTSTSDLFSRIDLIDKALYDKNSQVGQALLTNDVTKFNTFVKNNLNSPKEINEFQAIQNDWNQLNVNSQY